MPGTNFPTSLDDSTSLRTVTDAVDDILAIDQNYPRDAIVAIEAKLGITSSTPTLGKILIGTGDGTTTWTISLDTDVTLSANSDTSIPTQKATKTYIDSKIGNEEIQGQGIFFMSHFRSTDAKLYLASSNDGINWKDLSPSPIYKPNAGSVRDPSIVHFNNVWYCAYTNDRGNPKSFDIISSTNLIDWTLLISVDCSSITSNPANAGAAVWAPELFIDGETLRCYISIKSATAANFKIYEVHPTNAGFTTWSEPTEVFANAGEDVIDPFMVKINDTYFLWYKDETNKYIEYATSTSPTSGFTKIKNNDWAGWGSYFEGESLVQIDTDTWRIYFDDYVNQIIYYSESSDGFQTWSTKARCFNDVYMQHGTVLKITDFIQFRNLTGVNLSSRIKDPLSLQKGLLINGVFWATVTSNNLTVSVKTWTGLDPSILNPVAVRIGNLIHYITSALSVTLNAGTNWFGSGSAVLAALEADYFVYLGYNTTDGVVLGVSRVPYGHLYSHFSATTTDQNHIALSTATNAAATDEYEVIGRFGGILSAAAGHNWSLPTFTINNYIHEPIRKTRILPATAVCASGPTGITNMAMWYQIDDESAIIYFKFANSTFTGSGEAGIYCPIKPSAGDITGSMLHTGSAMYFDGSKNLRLCKPVGQNAWNGDSSVFGYGNIKFPIKIS